MNALTPDLARLQAVTERELLNLCEALGAHYLTHAEFVREEERCLLYRLLVDTLDDTECDQATELVLRLTQTLKQVHEPIRAIHFALHADDFDELCEARLSIFTRVHDDSEEELAAAFSTVHITEVLPDAIAFEPL